jgi:aryl-alcohol dehydrogenase-like predicted oxidoreductase
MEKRGLGATGLCVSRLGLGMAALARPGYITLNHAADLGGDYRVEVMRERSAVVLDAARRLGIQYYDVARSYGRGEEFLAHWLSTRSIAPDDVVVGSKWGYTYTANWQVKAEQHEVKEHTLAVLQRQWQESLSYLGAHLKLYQVHSATLESGVLERVEVLQELARMKEQGTAIGLTVSGPRQAETILAALNLHMEGALLFDTVQATWNLLETSCGTALELAHSAGLGVIVKEALANGRLTDRNDEPALRHTLERLQQVGREQEQSVDQLAVAAVLHQPWADVVLSGAAEVWQVESNHRALDVTLTEEQLAEMASWSLPRDEYWQQRSEMVWN